MKVFILFFLWMSFSLVYADEFRGFWPVIPEFKVIADVEKMYPGTNLKLRGKGFSKLFGKNVYTFQVNDIVGYYARVIPDGGYDGPLETHFLKNFVISIDANTGKTLVLSAQLSGSKVLPDLISYRVKDQYDNQYRRITYAIPLKYWKRIDEAYEPLFDYSMVAKDRIGLARINDDSKKVQMFLDMVLGNYFGRDRIVRPDDSVDFFEEYSDYFAIILGMFLMYVLMRLIGYRRVKK